jgi:hypothetical protein
MNETPASLPVGTEIGASFLIGGILFGLAARLYQRRWCDR